jgi:TPR repeat protein
MLDARRRPLALAMILAAGCFSGAAQAQAPAGVPSAPAAGPSLCNQLADDPEDPYRATPGVDEHAIDAAKAVPACEAALGSDPMNGRLWYAYFRALQRAGNGPDSQVAMENAANLAYPIAENLMGMTLLSARKVDQAAVWVRRAADHNFVPAQNMMATFYMNGLGVPKDPKQAVDWLNKAAARGYPLAQVSLAAIYHGGMGVPQDDVKAAEWAKKAADVQYAPAQSMLAGMYHNGWGVKKDDRAALVLYLGAGEQGYQPAQAQLGLVYHNGWGVPRDDKKAAEWLQKAADQGYQPAADMLAALKEDAAAAPAKKAAAKR